MTDEDLQISKKSGRWRNWALGFVVWTVIGLSFASRSYFTAYRDGVAVRWQEIFTGFLVDFWVWGLVSPLIFRLARAFPIEQGRLLSRIPLHILFSAVFILFANAVSTPAYWYFGSPNPARYPTLWSMYSDLFFSPFMLHQGLLVYWGTLIAAHAVEYYRQLQADRMRSAALASQLAEARLAALKMQIHPHFLFNTLNSIAALLHKDVEAADRMIARLSDFLRITLNSSESTATTLKQELEFLKTYLDIEKVRFQERLIVDMQVRPEALDARVPNLILQPIIENAIRHGVAQNADAGHISIDASRKNGRLQISIEDNGPGLNGNDHRSEPGNGVGLANTRERLNRFYEGDFRFEISDKAGQHGTVVKMDVPYLNQGREGK